MSDSDVTGTDTTALQATSDAAPEAGAAEPMADAPARTSWLFYGLGLSLQTLLWFLLFLALVVAIAVGGELTEFRYVGF